MSGRIVIVLVLSTALAACAMSPDPRHGGFIGGLQGIRTGAYDSRVQQRQAELSHQQSLNQGLGEQSNTFKSEVQARDLALVTEQQSLAKMENDISSLELDLNRLSAKSDQQKSEIAELNRKLENHRRQLKSQQSAVLELDRAGGSTADPGRYQILMQERDRLAKEYKGLVKSTLALSNAAR